MGHSHNPVTQLKAQQIVPRTLSFRGCPAQQTIRTQCKPIRTTDPPKTQRLHRNIDVGGQQFQLPGNPFAKNRIRDTDQNGRLVDFSHPQSKSIRRRNHPVTHPPRHRRLTRTLNLCGSPFQQPVATDTHPFGPTDQTEAQRLNWDIHISRPQRPSPGRRLVDDLVGNRDWHGKLIHLTHLN